MHNGGESLAHWRQPPRPGEEVLSGRLARLEPLNADRHAADLHRANCADTEGRIWQYLPYGPFASANAYRDWVKEMTGADDPRFFAVIERETGHAGGVMSLLRINPQWGSVEVGHINLAPELQRRAIGTEALFLLMRWVFESGYRRFEWKCDAANTRSRRAAQRFGFSYEGVFRQHLIVNARNRDTAWFAAIDKDWPKLSAAYARWLSPDNFDASGRQIERLGDLAAPARVADDPALADRA
ncbi:MAG: GNAT family N-acetyltransferase [Paracoccaceae bacterium]